MGKQRFGAAALVLMLTACATAPYGVVTGPLQRPTNPEDHGVVIVAADGKLVTYEQKRMKLPPGPHLLQLATVRSSLGGQNSYQPVALRVEPCMQYEFVARHDDPLSARTWQPVLVSETPIASCPTGVDGGVSK